MTSLQPVLQLRRIEGALARLEQLQFTLQHVVVNQMADRADTCRGQAPPWQCAAQGTDAVHVPHRSRATGGTFFGATSSTMPLPGSLRMRMRPMSDSSPMRMPTGGCPRFSLAGCRSDRSGLCASSVCTIAMPADRHAASNRCAPGMHACGRGHPHARHTQRHKVLATCRRRPGKLSFAAAAESVIDPHLQRRLGRKIKGEAQDCTEPR